MSVIVHGQVEETDRTDEALRLRTARRFVRNPAGMAGLICLLALAAAAVFSDLVAPYDPLAQDFTPLSGPNGTNWFGTDELGRDILSRIVHGSSSALVVALGASVLAAGLGVPVGLVAGYIGRSLDSVAMRVMDVLLAMPGLIVALVIVSVLGPGTGNLVLAIGLARMPVFARLARASTLTVRELDYVSAARGMGARRFDVMAHTVLPNITAPLIVQWAVSASVAMIAAASLSFLGLGVQPPMPSWGGMLEDSRAYLGQSPWYGIIPGVALVLGVASFDGIGRGLNDAMQVEHGTTPPGRSVAG